MNSLAKDSDEASVMGDEMKLILEALNAPNVEFKSNYDSMPKVQEQSKQTLKQK